MHALDDLIPTPSLLEIDHVDSAAPGTATWASVRRGDRARTPLIRALFMLRAIPERLAGRAPEPRSLRLADLKSTAEHPGFQLLSSDAPHEVAVGAIGKLWQPQIPFVHVPDANAYGRFTEPGFIKVAWALRVESLGTHSRLSMELRVDAIDRASWTKFQRYFRALIDNTPDGHGVFEVLRTDTPKVLILGGLFDPDSDQRLAFAAARPRRFWHVTCAFVLEPITATSTRVHVRARAAFSPTEALHAAWIRPVHHLMETAQLRHLRARVEFKARSKSNHHLNGVST